MNLPLIAGMGAAAYFMASPVRSKVKQALLGTTQPQETSATKSQSKPTGPSQMHIDPPVTTVGRNDKKSETLAGIANDLQAQAQKEAEEHPEVVNLWTSFKNSIF
jgi:hypothetical protein